MIENKEDERSYSVVKSNELIQRRRYSLSVQEQKTIAYICSLIKPGDKRKREFQFDINEYCKVCGLSLCGKNYNDIKLLLDGLSKKGFQIENDEMWTSVKWVEKPKIYKRSGTVLVRLDEDLMPYLFELKERFTQYELYNILAMHSSFSLRIYEILKSYQNMHRKRFELEDLKEKLMVQDVKSYANFKDFRKKVIEVAVNEINELTDIEVSWTPEKKGRKVVAITFEIKAKNGWDSLLCKAKTQKRLDKIS